MDGIINDERQGRYIVGPLDQVEIPERRHSYPIRFAVAGIVRASVC